MTNDIVAFDVDDYEDKGKNDELITMMRYHTILECRVGWGGEGEGVWRCS